ncbi:MAG: C25 family cysteine peptidase [Candidatus Edwardsbacteria bacterium]|nr:C25 family cysteine peptidase [Candidatus Edwardsbacteria bacterium]
MKYARITVGLIPALLATALISDLAQASGAIRLSGIRNDKPSVSLFARSDDAVTIACDLGALESAVIPASAMEGGSGEDFVLLSLSGGAHTGEIGKPKLPMMSAALDVPLDAVIELEITDAEQRTMRLSEVGLAWRITPALASVPKIDGARAQFAFDSAAYNSDALYPGKLAEVDDISSSAGLARGHRLAAVRFYPVQYNPATGELRYHPRLQVKVTFRNGNWTKTAALIARDYSPDWESLMQRLVINYDPLAMKAVLPLPVYYDIFYGGTYAAAAAKLADWKRRKGYTVRTWNASGWSAQGINDTIISQTPKATYLVIMSDPDGTDSLPASANGYATGMATDLYYAETDETGYLPDMFGARISVKTADEAMAAVDKAIRYEQADFGAAGTAWLKKALLIAGYDGLYQPVGIATNEYCRSILARHGYDVDTLILAAGEGNARAVPKVNAGVAWTVYSGHGSVTGWQMGGSYWNADQLYGDLSNLDMYTVPVGHCCLSGNFRSGSKAPSDNDCFGETWPKLAGRGGVTYFGSVSLTYWDEDDWLQRRYFDAIYDSVPGSPGQYLSEIGRFAQYGLYWIELNTSSGSLPNYKRYYFETYHVFNDPAMKIWTKTPLCVQITPAVVDINVPTLISLTLTDPDSGNAPVGSVNVYLIAKGQDTTLQGITDAAGPLSFSVTARDRRSLLLFGRKPGQTTDLFNDSIRVSAPAAFELKRIAPNPFGQSAVIAFNMYQDAEATITVYNLLGQKVRTLIAGPVVTGYHTLTWDGKDDLGRRLSSGIYFCRFHTRWTTMIQRMTMIK